MLLQYLNTRWTHLGQKGGEFEVTQELRYDFWKWACFEVVRVATCVPYKALLRCFLTMLVDTRPQDLAPPLDYNASFHFFGLLEFGERFWCFFSIWTHFGRIWGKKEASLRLRSRLRSVFVRCSQGLAWNRTWVTITIQCRMHKNVAKGRSRWSKWCQMGEFSVLGGRWRLANTQKMEMMSTNFMHCKQWLVHPTFPP